VSDILTILSDEKVASPFFSKVVFKVKAMSGSSMSKEKVRAKKDNCCWCKSNRCNGNRLVKT
jgi:hypothetical protein